MIIYNIGDDNVGDLIEVLFNARIEFYSDPEEADARGRLRSLDPYFNPPSESPISEGEVLLISPEQQIAISRESGVYTNVFSQDNERRERALDSVVVPEDNVLFTLNGLRRTLERRMADTSHDHKLSHDHSRAKVEVTVKPI